jgi:hypothetical protein
MDDRALLEQLAASIPEPVNVVERLHHRRAVKHRNARLGAIAVALSLVAVGVMFAWSALRTPDQIFVPVTTPPDPYEAVWISTDIADGSSQTLTIRSEEDGYQVVLVDEVASTFCGDQRGTMRGAAAPPDVGEDLIVEWRVLECDDGRRSLDPDPFEFRGDPSSGTLFDQSDTAWTRTP